MQHGKLHAERRWKFKPTEWHEYVSGDERRAFMMWSGMREPTIWGVCDTGSMSVSERGRARTMRETVSGMSLSRVGVGLCERNNKLTKRSVQTDGVGKVCAARVGAGCIEEQLQCSFCFEAKFKYQKLTFCNWYRITHTHVSHVRGEVSHTALKYSQNFDGRPAAGQSLT